MQRMAPGEALPALHDDVDIGAIELEATACPAGHLGGDDARARAEKGIVDRLPGAAVVDDRPAHALDRLLGAVPPALLAPWVAERVVVADLPHRGLGAVALPVALPTLTHRVPAGFMLPMVVATAQREVLLGPDNLRARLQPAAGETGGDDIAMHGAVPDIGDIAGKQRIGFPPVGTVIIEHRSLREFALAEVAARPPGRIVADPIGRIGDHQARL